MGTTAKIEQNKKIVRQLYEAVDNQDMDTFLALSAPNGMVHMPGAPEAIPLQEMPPIFKSFYTAFPDSIHDIKDTIAEGDKVSIRFTQIGTHKAEFNGIAPTGNVIKVEGHHMLRLADGRITDVWIVEDGLGMQEQLGMELKPKVDTG